MIERRDRSETHTCGRLAQRLQGSGEERLGQREGGGSLRYLQQYAPSLSRCSPWQKNRNEVENGARRERIIWRRLIRGRTEGGGGGQKGDKREKKIL